MDDKRFSIRHLTRVSIGAVLCAALLLVGVSPTSLPAAHAAQPASTFHSLLASLPTDESPSLHSGYVRSHFKLWLDTDRDGCNTRAEVLIAEALAALTQHGRCTIDSGSWYSPYDGVTLTSARKVDIDHMVPLKEAWLSGAYRWDAATRASFANDLGYPAALIAVSASSNRSKSDRDPAAWMPSNAGFRCEYAAIWVAVKYRWSLTVDSAERNTLANTLANCAEIAAPVPDKVIVTFSPENAASDANRNTVTEPALPTGGTRGSGDGVTDPDYGTCAAAHAAGRGPYYQAIDPEYGFYRDRDKDGMVCE